MWYTHKKTHSNSPHRTATLVVPSPTSSSWTRAMSTKTFAAALSRLILFSIVAPSLVTLTLWSCSEILWRILSIPLGPSVVLTRSAMAMAPMNDDRRAFSPCNVHHYGECNLLDKRKQKNDALMRTDVIKEGINHPLLPNKHTHLINCRSRIHKSCLHGCCGMYITTTTTTP